MRRLADRWWLVGLVLLCAVFTSTAVLVDAQRIHRDQRRQATEQQALALLHRSVGGVLGREAALARVLGVLRVSIGSRWPAFAQTVLSQPLANDVGFIAPVSEQSRASFERRTDLRLLDYARPGVFVPAPRRREYFVAVHAASRSGQSARLGVDLGARPLRRALLLRSAETNEQVASPPVGLISAAGARGVVVFEP